MTMKKLYRTLEQVWGDGLWPSEGGLCGPDPEQSQRHYAIYEVLCSLPEDAYQELVKKVYTFQWFIPWHRIGGAVMPFPASVTGKQMGDENLVDHAIVLYLSPCLEQSCYDSTVAVIAHELAHLIIGHKLYVGISYEDQEIEAWELVEEWGFGREARKHKGIMKALETREETLLRKELREMESDTTNI